MRDVFYLITQINNVTADYQRNTLVFANPDNDDIILALQNMDIEVDEAGQGRMEISIVDLPFYVFNSEVDFLSKVRPNNWDKSIGILDKKAFFSIEDGVTYENNRPNFEYFLLMNNFHAFDFLSFLKSQEHLEGNTF